MLPLVLLIAMSVVVSAQEIRVISAQGKSPLILGKITQEQYGEILHATKFALDEQVVQGLNSMDKKKGWKLQKFSLGLGVTGKIGIGPYQIGKSLKQRFVYSR